MDRYDDFCGDQNVSDFVEISKRVGHATPEGAARGYVDQLIRDGRISEVAEDEGTDAETLQAEVYADVLDRLVEHGY